MRSAIFPRIQKRWKSSTNKEGEACSRLHTMHPRRRGNPSTCHLRFVYNVGGLSHSRTLVSLEILPFSSFAQTLSFVWQTTVPFIRQGISFEETSRRGQRRIRLERTSWPSIFVKLRLPWKYSLFQGQASTPTKTGWVHPWDSSPPRKSYSRITFDNMTWI